jgi:holo-[acyl-carrier protein] synthase
MILGIGTDIVEISRIEKAITTDAFLRKCYTEEEIEQCGKGNGAENFAGYFAAKESVAKAIGAGFRGFTPRDVEIFHNQLGKPMVRLSQNVNIPADAQIDISISHGKDYATAMAIMWTKDKG